jgi:hypothetical protein
MDIHVGCVVRLKAKTKRGKDRLQHGKRCRVTKAALFAPEGMHGIGPFFLARNTGTWFWFDSHDDPHVEVEGVEPGAVFR